eukprot:ANDGO_02357.mRNA.1 RNA polymerase II C-terminal domain phosphatase-like 3
MSDPLKLRFGPKVSILNSVLFLHSLLVKPGAISHDNFPVARVCIAPFSSLERMFSASEIQKRTPDLLNGKWLLSVDEMAACGPIVDAFCEVNGTITSVSKEPGQFIAGDLVVGTVDPCRHEQLRLWKCLICNAEVPAGPRREEYVNWHEHPDVQILKTTAQQHAVEQMSAMEKSKKLFLVLDIDHTLLHASMSTAPQMSRAYNQRLETLPEYQTWDEDTKWESRIHDLYFAQTYHAVKFRPGLRRFLRESHAMFQLLVFTFGSRPYAEAVVKVFDPQRNFFSSRIVSRDDCPDGSLKTLERLFSANHHSVLIVDDSPHVWNYVRNVITIPKYVFFPEVDNRPLDPSGQRGLDIDYTIAHHAPLPTAMLDSSLASVFQTLSDVHKSFFAAPADSKKDVTQFLKEREFPSVGQFLFDCVIVFSGLIPRGEPRPESFDLWKKAEACGASCSLTMTSETTHLVTASVGTEKAQEALQRGDVFVVKPAWVNACYELRERMFEVPFLFMFTKSKQLNTPDVPASGEELVDLNKSFAEQDRQTFSEYRFLVQEIKFSLESLRTASEQLQDFADMTAFLGADLQKRRERLGVPPQTPTPSALGLQASVSFPDAQNEHNHTFSAESEDEEYERSRNRAEREMEEKDGSDWEDEIGGPFRKTPRRMSARGGGMLHASTEEALASLDWDADELEGGGYESEDRLSNDEEAGY